MSSNGPLSPRANVRIAGFSAIVWIVGIVLVVVLGATSLPDDVAGETAEDFRYEPWRNPDPPVAEDEGDGIHSGDDGAVIRLQGLDPQQPVVIEELDDTTVFEVHITGPSGRIDVEGPYGEPPSFGTWVYGLGQLHAVVHSSEAELWVDAPSDERWRIRVSQPELPAAAGTVSGFGPRVLRYTGDATTARLSARGEGRLTVTVTTETGSDELVWEEGRFDRSIAWPDADVVLFVVDGWEEKGWSIAFEEPATPPATPVPTPVTTAPGSGG